MSCFQLWRVDVLATVSLVLMKSSCWWGSGIFCSHYWKWLHVIFELTWLGFWHRCYNSGFGYALLLVVKTYFLSSWMVVLIPLCLAIRFLYLLFYCKRAVWSLLLLSLSCALLVPFEWLLNSWESMLVFLQFVHLLFRETDWLGHHEKTLQGLSLIIDDNIPSFIIHLYMTLC